MLEVSTCPPYRTLSAQSVDRSTRALARNRSGCQKTSLPSTNDVSLLYPEAVMRSSDAIGWQDIRVIHLRHRMREWMVPPSDRHCLLLNLGPSLLVSIWHGNISCEGQLVNGKVAIIPAGWLWMCGSNQFQKILLLYLRPLFVRLAVPQLDLPYLEAAIRPEIGFKDEGIRHVALSLLHELNQANALGRTYANSLATGLAMQFARRYSSLKNISIRNGGMAPFKLRKAIDLIDKYLANEDEGRISLRIVAKEVGISYFHFSRAFKQSMGISLTQYIAERRIENAKRLLQETELPISEIALRSGFSSQSHFTTSFRKLAGTTPRAFRATL